MLHLDPPPLIVTMGLDEMAQTFFDALRDRHFPKERNHLRAHLTLFQALPGAHLNEIVAYLTGQASALSRQPEGLVLAVEPPVMIGRGVAYPLRAPWLVAAHDHWRRHWVDTYGEAITRQDRQGQWPHVTVQNKVTPDEARALVTELAHTPYPTKAIATRLEVYRYRGGPWELAHSIELGG